MKIIETEIKDNCLIATVETDPSIFDKHYLKYFNIAQQNVKIKGFRKGKVPLEIAKDYVNYDYVNEKSFNAVVMDTLFKLVKAPEFTKFETFDSSLKNEIIDFKHEEKKIIFKSYFEVKPDVVLGDYSKIYTIFEPKDLKDIYWMEPSTEINDNAVIYVKMYVVNSEKIGISKYSHESLEIDLEKTKIDPTLIKGIRSGELGKEHEFKYSVDGKEHVVYSQIIACFKKAEFSEEILLKINNPNIKNLDDLKKLQKEMFEKYNEDSLKAIVIKWTSSDNNKLSYVPAHSISVESKKIMQNYLKSRRNTNLQDKKIQQTLFDNIFYDNLIKIKVACAIEKIADDLKIEVTEKEIEDATKKFKLNIQAMSTISEKDLEDPEVFKSIARQEKCIELLKKNIIFSS